MGTSNRLSMNTQQGEDPCVTCTGRVGVSSKTEIGWGKHLSIASDVPDRTIENESVGRPCPQCKSCNKSRASNLRASSIQSNQLKLPQQIKVQARKLLIRLTRLIFFLPEFFSSLSCARTQASSPGKLFVLFQKRFVSKEHRGC